MVCFVAESAVFVHLVCFVADSAVVCFVKGMVDTSSEWATDRRSATSALLSVRRRQRRAFVPDLHPFAFYGKYRLLAGAEQASGYLMV